MSPSLAKKLVQYRSWITAIVNAGITWIILIIAPLGLFAVITCTLGVFLGSLIVGWISDRALFELIDSNHRDIMSARRDSEHGNFPSTNHLDLPTQQKKRANQTPPVD